MNWEEIAKLLAYLSLPVWGGGSFSSLPPSPPPSARSRLCEKYIKLIYGWAPFKSLVMLELASSGIIVECLRDNRYFTKSCDTTNWQQICLANSREKKDSELESIRWRHVLSAYTVISPPILWTAGTITVKFLQILGYTDRWPVLPEASKAVSNSWVAGRRWVTARESSCFAPTRNLLHTEQQTWHE